MKYGQLIEYDIRNIFRKNLCTRFGGETIPKPFTKKSKLKVSLDQ